MPRPPSPSPDDRFHSPQGDRPCPDTYQPRAWLTRPPAKPAPTTPYGQPHTGQIAATLREALRKLREGGVGEDRHPGGPAG
jgi:hypothetical protein